MISIKSTIFGFVLAAVLGLAAAGLLAWQAFWPNEPTAIVLATLESDTLDGLNGVDPIAPALRDLGYSVFSIDLPCHSAEMETSGLVCWNSEIASGNVDLLSGFCAEISNKIDEIGARRVQYVGVSRGGYVAFECAALDPRVTDVAQIAPVVDLSKLYEFDGNSLVGEMTLDRYARNLAQRNTLIRIGVQDDRVGTDAVVNYGRLVGSEIHLLKSEGHRAPDPENHMAAWLMQKWHWPF